MLSVPLEVWGWYGDGALVRKLRRLCLAFGAVPLIPVVVKQYSTATGHGAVEWYRCGRYSATKCGDVVVFYENARIAATSFPADSCMWRTDEITISGGAVYSVIPTELCYLRAATGVAAGAIYVFKIVSRNDDGPQLVQKIRYGSAILSQVEPAYYEYCVVWAWGAPPHYGWSTYYSHSPPATFVGIPATLYSVTRWTGCFCTKLNNTGGGIDVVDTTGSVGMVRRRGDIIAVADVLYMVQNTTTAAHL